jgi:primosomal protein N' (replication factor Y)
VLDAELLSLGRWIAAYYCAPLGEVLRGMLPLAADLRQGKVWTLTDSGRDVARQLLLDSEPDDPTVQVLRMLERRPLSAAYLARALPLADKAIRSLERRGFIVAEQVEIERDPLRAGADHLRVELKADSTAAKLTKAERELRAFLELHPGSHNLKDLTGLVKQASEAARSLARKGLVSLVPEPVAIRSGPVRTRHALNTAQQMAYNQIRTAIEKRRFHAFLLHGVTGSGKTEVYLSAIETVLEQKRSAILMVPEIALTPAMAGQFYSRFPDQVAILHSAFTDVERSEQWRRIRSGAAPVVVGTRACLLRCAISASSWWTKNTTAATNKKRRRATTGATLPSCGRRPPGPASYSAPPPPAWKAGTMRKPASTTCSNCPRESKSGPCRRSS